VIAPRTDAVAIVTGGSYGTGREVVRMLAPRGYAIVVVYLDDQRRAEATVEEIFAADGTAVAVRADVTDALDVERLFDETIAAFGGVHAVVHTTMQSASVLYQHAVRHLHRGSAVVSGSTAEEIPPALAQQLRERDITVTGFPPGLEDEGAEHGVADLISFLDRRRRRSTR
jgi:NAD(P)-dependent dehydrogenase (short-subunit alcohol dehydrogenase family)